MTELTYREALHQTIVEEMHKNSDVFIMGECVDEAAMDELFERACCGRFGYDRGRATGARHGAGALHRTGPVPQAAHHGALSPQVLLAQAALAEGRGARLGARPARHPLAARDAAAPFQIWQARSRASREGVQRGTRNLQSSSVQMREEAARCGGLRAVLSDRVDRRARSRAREIACAGQQRRVGRRLGVR
jgi:hypothetical protein